MEHVLSLAAIRDQKAALNRAILEAQSQLADLEVAERIVRRFGQATEEARPSADDIEDLLGSVPAPLNPAPLNPAPTLLKINGALTTRQLLTSILREAASVWMNANDLQERASAIKGQTVPMATVSPTLSNMKNDGVIVRDGLKVALAERLKENEPPAVIHRVWPTSGSETAQAAQ